MIVPAVGGLASKLSEGLTNSVSGQTTNALSPSGQPSANASNLGVEAGAGPEGTSGVTGVEGTSGVEGAGGAGGSGSSSFGSELSEAISSLEGTQQSADSAAQSLATGTAKDPESAVVTVEDAQMAMDLAAQLRTKATEAAQSIFQTQV
ncbi:MAG TPA: flagellar hook-basal body complex protein FliE [Solirubrobacteraceae bacterium]